jgi:3-hydroxyisobutyrate dehydrogenase
MSHAAQTVGIIGIGQLGMPIADNLMKAGFRVVGYRRTDIHQFVERGGVAAASPADVAAAADVLLLCLPGEEASRDALAGPDGVLAGLKPGQPVIELGTYRKQFKLEQAALLERHGARPLEAEVSGSPPMIAARKGALYLGGDATLVETCRPVLEAIAEKQFHLGPYGAAVAIKLIANYLLTIHTLAAAEAINMGARAGFDPQVVAEVIGQGAGTSAMFTLRGPMMAARRFTPAPGPFTTLEKYLDLAGGMARELGCATPLFDAAAPYFYRGLHSEMAGEDIAAVIKLIESDSTPLTPKEPQ